MVGSLCPKYTVKRFLLLLFLSKVFQVSEKVPSGSSLEDSCPIVIQGYRGLLIHRAHLDMTARAYVGRHSVL